MLTVRSVLMGSTFLHVTGYADGSDWLLNLEAEREDSFGVTGPYLWVVLRQGLAIYDADRRRLIGSIVEAEKTQIRMAEPSHDGKRLFAVSTRQTLDNARPPNVVESESMLMVIDMAEAVVTARHRIDRYMNVEAIAETADGHVIVANKTNGEYVPGTLLRVDPASGAVDRFVLEGTAPLSSFRWPSPDGRYWLRNDQRVASTTVSEKAPGLFGKRSETVYYANTLQLWEVWPPRFVKWLPIGWLPFEAMPNERKKYRQVTEDEVRRAGWTAVVAASEAAPYEPLTAVPDPKHRAPYSDPDKPLDETRHNWRLFTGFYLGHHGWDADGTGFWADTEGVVTHVRLDGSVSAGSFVRSPRQPFERMGAGETHQLPGHRLETGAYYGRAIHLGTGTGPAPLIEISHDGPNWKSREQLADPAFDARLEAAKKDRSRIVVQLPEWSNEAVTAAIDAVAAEIKRSLKARSDQVYPVFMHGGREVSEQAFFERVEAEFPAAAPAIGRLLTVAADASSASREVYGESFEVGLLGHAARALGLMDAGSLPILMRYRDKIIETEHETYFTTQTVPLLVQRHGWTEPMIAFVWWLLLMGNTNGIDNYGTVWRDWGFGDAVTGRYSPAAFATLTQTVFGAPETKGRHPAEYSYHGIDDLVRDMPNPAPWLAEFFALMRTKKAG